MHYNAFKDKSESHPLTTELQRLFGTKPVCFQKGWGEQNICFKAAFQEDILTVFSTIAQSKSKL